MGDWLYSTLDLILNDLHKKFGYCGHCGRNTCVAKADDNSKLPATIPTRELLAILNEHIEDK